MRRQKQAINQKARGLFPQFDPSESPDGALLEAMNVVFEREGIISKRRGLGRYGSVLSGAPDRLLEYMDRVIVHQGQRLHYDSDGLGTWVTWDGAFRDPDSEHKIRSTENSSNLFLTTSEGIYVTDALTTSPRRAGMPQGLDIELTKTGTGGGWFTPGTQVGYRVLFGRENANDQLILGAPSEGQNEPNASHSVTLVADGAGNVNVTHTAHGFLSGYTIEILNPSDEVFEAGPHVITTTGVDSYSYTISDATSTESGTADAGIAYTMTVDFTIPHEVAAGDFVEIYRSALSGSAGTVPANEYFKVERVELEAADITAGTYVYADTFDEAFLGERLYTSSSRETLSKENSRPPFSKDIAEFREHVFYGNTRQEHYIEVQLRTYASLTVGGSITLRGSGEHTFTAAASEDIGAGEFLRSTAESTTAGNIIKTVESLLRVINRSDQTEFVAFYASQEDDPPGKFVIRKTTFDATSFTIESTANGAFDPDLGTIRTSQNDAKKNRLYRSKVAEGEAVPRLNYRDLDGGNDGILRVLALKRSLIILRENSIWRLTGDTERDFDYSELDPSIKLLANETAVVLNNAVFALTNQGVVRIDEGGVRIESRGIENELKEVFGYTGWETKAHAIAYERERLYILFTPSSGADEVATEAWVYNHFLQAWSKWSKPCKGGIVLSEDEKLYLCHGEDAYVLQERRDGSSSNFRNYRDEDITVTITATSTTTWNSATVTTVTVTSTYAGWTPAAGGLLTLSTGYIAKVVAVTDNGSDSYTLTLDRVLTVTLPGGAGAGGFGGALKFMGLALSGGELTGGGGGTAEATLSIPIRSRIRWAPEEAKNPASSKQFQTCQIHFERNRAFTHRIGFITDADATEEFVNDILLTSTSGWGQGAWGQFIWGGNPHERATPIRTVIPRPKQRCRALSAIYEHNYAGEFFHLLSMSLRYRMVSERTTRAMI